MSNITHHKEENNGHYSKTSHNTHRRGGGTIARTQGTNRTDCGTHLSAELLYAVS